MKTLLTAKELAQSWHCSLNHIYAKTRAGLIPAIKIGSRSYRYDPDRVQALQDKGGVERDDGQDDDGQDDDGQDDDGQEDRGPPKSDTCPLLNGIEKER